MAGGGEEGGPVGLEVEEVGGYELLWVSMWAWDSLRVYYDAFQSSC